MTRAWRAVAAAFAVLLAGLVLTGCGAIEAIVDTEAALEREGFRDATVSYYSDSGEETVTVSWTATAETTEALQEESRAAAGVVWRVAPVYFDAVETMPDTPALGDPFVTGTVYPRAELERQHGPRPEGLDQSAGELLNVRGLVFGSVLALLAGTAVVVGIVLLVLRSARGRKAAPGAAYPPPAGYPSGYPAYPGYPPPGPPGPPAPPQWAPQWAPPPPPPWDPQHPYQPPPG